MRVNGFVDHGSTRQRLGVCEERKHHAVQIKPTPVVRTRQIRIVSILQQLYANIPLRVSGCQLSSIVHMPGSSTLGIYLFPHILPAAFVTADCESSMAATHTLLPVY